MTATAMTAIKLHVDRIRVDGGTQTRAGLNAEAVADYAEVIGELPPVVVFHDGTDYWLGDGFHRVAAARKAGVQKLSAEVRQGTQRDARLHSAGANADHGLRRTNADIERAVTMLLTDDEWRRKGTAWVAARAAVSERTVRNHEARLIAGGKLSELPTKRGKDGKSYPATRGEVTTTPEAIGAALAQVEAEEVSLPPTVPSVTGPESGLLLAAPGAAETTPPEYDGDEWYTPAKYVEAARQVMGGIDLDPASCAHAQETVKAATYYTKEVDGLVGKWLGRVWLNPPYSDPAPWAGKLLEEYESGRVKEAVLLVNNATDTGWFQELLQAGLPVCFPVGRIRFERPDVESGSNRYAQAFFYFGDMVGRFAQTFGTIGTVVANWGYRRPNGDAVTPVADEDNTLPPGTEANPVMSKSVQKRLAAQTAVPPPVPALLDRVHDRLAEYPEGRTVQDLARVVGASEVAVGDALEQLFVLGKVNRPATPRAKKWTPAQARFRGQGCGS